MIYPHFYQKVRSFEDKIEVSGILSALIRGVFVEPNNGVNFIVD
jgi:hypothetical protein